MPSTADLLEIHKEFFQCGPVKLAWRSVTPESAAHAELAILHGYGEHSGRYREFMRWMAERGIACHALDFRGHGTSGGRRGFVERWDEYLEDVAAFLRLECSSAAREDRPLFVLGHSHGGLVLTAAVIQGKVEARGCILSAPFLKARMRVPAYKVAAARLLNGVLPWMPIPNGLRPEWMSSDEAMLRESVEDRLLIHAATPRWYLTCLAAQEEVRRRAPEFRLPLLVLAGDADPVADPRAAHDFFEAAGSEDKTFRPYPDHLHELLRETRREAIFGHILQWIEERAG